MYLVVHALSIYIALDFMFVTRCLLISLQSINDFLNIYCVHSCTLHESRTCKWNGEPNCHNVVSCDELSTSFKERT